MPITLIKEKIMINLDNHIDNLYNAIRLLQSQITRNIFNGEQKFSVFSLGNDITSIIYETDFDFKISDITSLSSYQELLEETPPRSREYLYSRIEEFYQIWIEPVKAVM